MALVFVACGNSDDCCVFPEQEEMEEEMEGNPAVLCSGCIDMNDPQVGQLNKYVLFTDVNYYRPDTNGVYRNDTLVLEIVEVNGNEVHLIESLSAESNVVVNPDEDPKYYWYDGNENPVVWNLTDEVLSIEKNTPTGCQNKLTFATQQLSFVSQDSLQSQFGDFLPSPQNGDHAQDTEIRGEVYDYLQLAVNNGAFAFDGDGMTIVYSRELGLVRTFSVSAWTGMTYGWDLLEE